MKEIMTLMLDKEINIEIDDTMGHKQIQNMVDDEIQKAQKRQSTDTSSVVLMEMV